MTEIEIIRIAERHGLDLYDLIFTGISTEINCPCEAGPIGDKVGDIRLNPNNGSV